MFETPKNILRDWLFKSYKAELDREHQERIDSIDMLSVLRAKMAGFDPKLVQDDRDILDMLEEGDSQMSFLRDMKTLKNNESLYKLKDWLQRNQVVKTALEAPDISAINYGRTTVLGIATLIDEVERLADVYEERTKEDEPFDRHEAV